MKEPPAGRERRRRLLLLAGVALAVIGADQASKSAVVANLSGHPLHLIGPVGLRLEYNSGVAFSIGSGLTEPIILVVVALVLGVVWFARRVPTATVAVGVGLILGGALGNLSDRIFRAHHGAVVDFIYTRYWPTFNVADACIVCGCALVAWSFVRSAPKEAGDGKAA